MIYFVEDDNSIRKLVLYSLTSAGLEAEGFARPSAFWAALDRRAPEVVLLDIMLPEEDGISILKKLREDRRTRSVQVILLTAKGSEYDKVVGLDAGADDYVSKPFSPKELMARVGAVLKRAGGQKRAGSLTFGGLTIQPAARSMTVDGKAVSLPPKEFDLLLKLAEHEHMVFTRDQLLDQIWGFDYFGDARTVDTHIKALREHLGPYRGLIETVWGVGYKFERKE